MKYDNTFKLEALKLSDEIGVRKAAAQLGIPYYTLAEWRSSERPKANRPRFADQFSTQNISVKQYNSNNLYRYSGRIIMRTTTYCVNQRSIIEYE